ncbi:MAG: hypothetical protein KAX49_09065 [Halanaerobiales bacterium]|nr:hypothetical protein [Halanaerobiales bacterium]
METEEKKLVEKLFNRVERLSDDLHKMNLAEYTEIVRSPRRMIFLNFIAGVARGLGFAVGATILGAMVLAILFKLADLNIPGIGFFIAKIVKIVQTYL